MKLFEAVVLVKVRRAYEGGRCSSKQGRIGPERIYQVVTSLLNSGHDNCDFSNGWFVQFSEAASLPCLPFVTDSNFSITCTLIIQIDRSSLRRRGMFSAMCGLGLRGAVIYVLAAGYPNRWKMLLPGLFKLQKLNRKWVSSWIKNKYHREGLIQKEMVRFSQKSKQ